MNIKRGLATLAIAALSLTSLAACGSDTAQYLGQHIWNKFICLKTPGDP